MSGPVLLILLVVGVFVASTRLPGGYGLLSGAELLVLGVLLGPRALGIVDEDLFAAVQSAVTLASSWIGLLLGLRWRRSALGRLGLRGAASILIEAGGTLAVIAFGLPLLLRGQADALGDPAAAFAIALVAAPSGRSAVAWARRRLRASGPTVERLEALAGHDELVGVLALLAYTTLRPPSTGDHRVLPPLVACAAAVLLGGTLGGAFTLLGGRRPDRDTAWVNLIGVGLLAAGIASRLALPGVVVSFLLGATIAATTAEHALLDEIVATTEQPVVLLLLLLVGLQIGDAPGLALVAGAAVALRVVAKVAAGPLLAPLGAGGPAVGAGLLGFGGVALAAAAEIAGLQPGRTGALVLGVAAAQAIVGGLAGPLGLRGLLDRRGEMAAPPVEVTRPAGAATGPADEASAPAFTDGEP